MKYSIIGFILFLTVQFSNSSAQNDYSAMKNAKSIEIYKSGSTVALKSFTDAKEVSNIKSFVTSKPTPIYKCGHQGKIVFINGDTSFEVEFNSNESCAHVIYVKGKRLVTRKLSKEGQEYLEGLLK